MKAALILITGILLGLVFAHAGGIVFGQSDGGVDFARFHGGLGKQHLSPDDSTAAAGSAMSLMQTDIALCDQPYFVEVYELSVEYFATGIDNVQAEDFAELMFDHARHSGYFSAQEAEAWIEHIKAVPGQFVEIIREDPAVLDNCYNFQVAAVGPPA